MHDYHEQTQKNKEDFDDKLNSQCIDISKGLVTLVLVIIFIFGNLKDCLMEILQLLLKVIKFLLIMK